MNRITQWVANILVLAALLFPPTFKNGDYDLLNGSVTYRNSLVSDGYRFLGFSFPLSSGFAYLDVDTLLFEAFAIGAILFWVNSTTKRKFVSPRDGARLLPLALGLGLVLFQPTQIWTTLGNNQGHMQWNGFSLLFSAGVATVVDPRILFLEIGVLFFFAATFIRWFDGRAPKAVSRLSEQRAALNEPDDSPMSQTLSQHLGLASR
jgi:hypothetical protein